MKKQNYNIDIIMGIYNCERYLEDCFNSLLAQTFKNWRLIMCEDGSSDNTLKVAESIAKKYPEKVLLLKNPKNMGLNYTLNKCLQHSSAKYVARQDADDLSTPERLEIEYNFLEKNPHYAFCSTAAKLMDENGVWGQTKGKPNPSKNDFIYGSPFNHASSMINRKILQELGNYSVDKRLLRVEDYHLWFKFYEKGYKGYNIQTPLYYWRDDRDATSRRTWQNRLNEYYVKKIGFKMLGLPLKYRIFIFRPIIIGLLPKFLYTKLHQAKLKKTTRSSR